MAFCFNCGNKIDIADIFCPSCGERLIEEIELEKRNKPSDIEGIILTDTLTLSKKMNCSQRDVVRLIQDYIHDIRRKITYKLLDINTSDGRSKIFSELEKTATENSKYLFIIGGHDIIPMFVIKHTSLGSTSDKDIDTDIFFSHLYRNSADENAVLNCIKTPTKLYVGRLPASNDFQFLKNYLDNASENRNGIKPRSIYGQTDPHWSKVSYCVSSVVLKSKEIKCIDINSVKGYVYKHLYTSPKITADIVSSVFNKEASIYYFNLHGSNAPSSAGYYGESMSAGYVTAITPKEFLNSKKANIVVSEACYGARFINLKTEYSMLLSALSSKTLIYLGSSRIAWGSVDTDSMNGMRTDTHNLNLADRMTSVFMDSMLKGYTAGESLAIAKESFRSTNRLTPISLATLAEFNLFGDPCLGFDCKDRRTKEITEENIEVKSYKQTQVYKKDGGILSLVRGMVDKNIAEIRDSINKELYQWYGIEARELANIVKVDYSDGETEYIFKYQKEREKNSEITKEFMAISDNQGKLIDLYSSK